MRSAVLTRLARLSVRLRVTLAFTLVMAALLAATGLFLHARLGDALNDALDRGLAERSDDIATLLRRSDGTRAGGSVLRGSGERLAQLFDRRGRLLDTTQGLGPTSLLTRAQALAAGAGPVRATRGADEDPRAVRLLARPVTIGGRPRVLVVAASVQPDRDAQRHLDDLLLVGLPIALLLAALAGYGAVSGALRPVELMRRRAQTITAGRPDRLPVPPTDDEIAALGRTLNDMLDRLDQAYARERRFVADASHELRTPLTILRGELELAMRDAQTVAEFREAIASAGEETERLVRLAEDLLVITRADQGRLPVRRASIPAAEILASVAQRFARLARETGVTLAVADVGAVVVDGDRMLVEQALGNLVDNALRHARSRVELGVGEDGALCVRDDGPGFDVAFLGEAFDRFSRAEPDRGRDSGGAGLGMAIVAAIAEAHGGGAYARNRDGGGAEVGLTLA